MSRSPWIFPLVLGSVFAALATTVVMVSMSRSSVPAVAPEPWPTRGARPKEPTLEPLRAVTRAPDREPEPRRTSATTAVNDPAWLGLPRNDLDMARIIVLGPLLAAELYRNTGANPRDLRIAVSDRELLERYCPLKHEQLTRLRQQKGEAVLTDFDRLVRSGQAHETDIRASRAALPPELQARIAQGEDRMLQRFGEALGMTLEQVRADPTTSIVSPTVDLPAGSIAHSSRGGVVYSATLAELPNATAITQRLRSVTFEVGLAIVSYFVHHGCLTASEGAGLTDRILRRIVAELPA
ncbi:MAG: hypothetical protein ACI9OJ_004631 [Myxococcota bacterium]|jgi:hypothetical protein